MDFVGYESPEELVQEISRQSTNGSLVFSCGYQDIGVGYTFRSSDPAKRYYNYWTITLGGE